MDNTTIDHVPPTSGRDKLARMIRTHLVAGFWSYDDIAAYAHEALDDFDDVDPGDAAALVDSMWKARLAEQATWADTGDFGRLEQTFAQLESEGILARMCFTCCSTCANSEIDDERTPAPDTDDWYPYREWAYTYFHQQDALRLAEPDPVLLLGYSAFRPHPDLPRSLVDAAADGDQAAHAEVVDRTDTLVGQRIAALARHFGLTVSWSGSRRERISLSIPEWRKPLPQ